MKPGRFFYSPLPAGLFLIVGLLGVSSPLSAEIFKYTDGFGRIYYTDTPMKGRDYRLLAHFVDKTKSKTKKRTGRSRIDTASFKKNRRRFSPLIEEVANDSRLRPELLHAIVRAESAYDPRAVSRRGAVGLMQLMPETAKRYGVSNRRNPRQNLEAGARYFRDLLVMFEYDVRLAIAAYNAGENAVIRSGYKIPDYPETRQYVAKVMRFFKQYRRNKS